MEKENQRIFITKRMLKEALLKLLEKKEIGKISVTELCNAAEINRATFYRHYGVPQDVLAEIENDLIDKIRQAAPFPASIKSAEAYLEKVFSFIYANADVVRRLLQTNTDSNFIELLDRSNRTILASMLRNDSGETVDEASVKLISAYLSGGEYHMVRAWLLGGITKTPREIAGLITELIVRDLDSFRFD